MRRHTRVLGMQSSCAAVIKSSELTLWEDSWMAECVHESDEGREKEGERQCDGGVREGENCIAGGIKKLAHMLQ